MGNECSTRRAALAEVGLHSVPIFLWESESPLLFSSIGDCLGIIKLLEALEKAYEYLDTEEEEERRLRESKDVEDMVKWKHKEERERQKQRRRKEERAAIWTTPGLRPLAEPPDMDWPTILKNEYSDARLSALFRDDPAKRSQAKDLFGEVLALSKYHDSCQGMLDLCESSNLRGRFYYGLRSEVTDDLEEVMAEWDALHKTATQLGHFEHEYLDADGGTTTIQHFLLCGSMCLACRGVDVEAKYRHLAPTGYQATPLGMFEYVWLDTNNGTSLIEKELLEGRNLMAEWQDEEVSNKYANLVRGRFPNEYLDARGLTTNTQHLLRSGRVCYNCKGYGAQVEVKNRHLAPSGQDVIELRLFEYLWLGPNKSTSRIEAELARGHNPIDRWPHRHDVAIPRKYNCLARRYLDTLANFENDYAPPDQSNVTFEQSLKDRLGMGANVFTERDSKVMAKYGHLMSNYRPRYTRLRSGRPGTVAAFENQYDFSKHGEEHFEGHLKQLLNQGNNVLEYWNTQVMEKYGHLMAHYRPRPKKPVWPTPNQSQDFDPETGFQALENLLSKEQSDSNALGGADEDS